MPREFLMFMIKLDIDVYLQELARQGELVFCPNGGDAGDALIACATFQLFDQAGISYRLFNADHFDPTGKILVLGGGGNLVPEYSTAAKLIQAFHARVKKLVLLPHTVAGHEDLLARLGSNVDLIAREETSFKHLRRSAPNANIFIADDLAFQLDPEKILATRTTVLPLFASRQLRWERLLKIGAATLKAAAERATERPGARVLNCFRTDAESSGRLLPRHNVDLSLVCKCGVATPAKAFYSASRVFRFINSYDTVRTDRLHMAIAGALLGKQVQFYPNSYYKCAAVYSFSMKERFPNVQWMGASL